MRLHTPAQLEAFTGVSTQNQRLWRSGGLLEGRGERTTGGHWRYRDGDVLLVAAMRVIAPIGFELQVARDIANRCLPEIADALRGRDPSGEAATHPFIFVWPRADATSEADQIATGAGPDHYVLKLADLGRIPDLSRSGGFVLVLEDIARKIPAPVADLIREDA